MSKSRIFISIMSFQKCLLVEVELFRYGFFSSTEKIVQIYSTLVYFLDGVERSWCQKIEVWGGNGCERNSGNQVLMERTNVSGEKWLGWRLTRDQKGRDMSLSPDSLKTHFLSHNSLIAFKIIHGKTS